MFFFDVVDTNKTLAKLSNFGNLLLIPILTNTRFLRNIQAPLNQPNLNLYYIMAPYLMLFNQNRG